MYPCPRLLWIGCRRCLSATLVFCEFQRHGTRINCRMACRGSDLFYGIDLMSVCRLCQCPQLWPTGCVCCGLWQADGLCLQRVDLILLIVHVCHELARAHSRQTLLAKGVDSDKACKGQSNPLGESDLAHCTHRPSACQSHIHHTHARCARMMLVTQRALFVLHCIGLIKSSSTS